jgi:hypothetical protein
VADGRIELRRETGHYRDRLRAYKVLVDGEPAGAIKAGETLTLPAAPGRHAVQLRISWCRSPELEVDVPAGGAVALRCRPGGSAANALYDITLGRSSYIALEPAELTASA